MDASTSPESAKRIPMRMNNPTANGRHIYRIIVDRFQGNSAVRHAHFETGGEKVAIARNLSATGCVQAMKTGWDPAAGRKLRLTHDQRPHLRGPDRRCPFLSLAMRAAA